MAVTNGWGQAAKNNTNGFGKLATNNIGAGSIYENSYSGDTALIGTSAAFSYDKSSFNQSEANPTPTITGTTGGTFSSDAGVSFVSTSTGEIDLSASTIASHTIFYIVDGVQASQTIDITAAPFSNIYSFEFDGIDEEFILSSNFVGSGEFTLSLWIKPTALNNNQNVLGFSSSGSNWINTSSTTLIRVKMKSGSPLNFVESGGNNLVLNAWNHILIYRDSSNDIGVFVNGATFGSTINNSLDINLKTIGRGTSTKFFEGNIDEVAFWNTNESSDISSIYSGGTPSNLSLLSPIHWYRMGDEATFNSGTGFWTLTDQGSGGNNATSNNMEEADRKTNTP